MKVFFPLCLAAVRVGIVGEDVVINPTRRQLHNSSLNIILTGTTQRRVGKTNNRFGTLTASQYSKAELVFFN